MSNISNRHNVLAFVAGKSEPLSGQRLAKVGYKKTKDVPNPPQSICVSIPQFTNEQILARAADFLPVIREAIHGLQDGIIRSLYESRNHSITEFSSVSDDEISLDACIAFAESERNGGRITAEFLKSWFAKEMGDSL